MAGLIGATPEQDKFTASQKALVDAANNPVTALNTSTPATKPVVAEEWKVDDKQTVRGQINGLINANDPLQQLSTTAAKQEANKTGLANSSMALGAIQDANVRAALPIAQQDAQTYGAAAQTNTAAKNDIGKFNTEIASKEGMFGKELASKESMFGQELASKESMFEAEQAGLNDRFTQELAQNMEQFNLSEANKTTLLELEQQYKQSIQTSANTATLFNSYFQQVAAIQSSPNLNADGKETAIANLTTMLQDGVAAQDVVSGLNIEGMIFPDTPVTPAATAVETAAPTATTQTTQTTTRPSSNVIMDWRSGSSRYSD